MRQYKDENHQEIGENMIKHCMTHDINTINIPQYNPSQHQENSKILICAYLCLIALIL